MLAGNNNYGGVTTVAGGSLILTNNEAVADGSSLIVGNASYFSPLVSDTAPAGLGGSPQAAAVPEPGTMGLALAGLALAFGAWWKRKRDIQSCP